MRTKIFLVFSVLLILISTLHLPHNQYVHQTLNYRLTDRNFNHLQEPTNKTDPKLIQAHLDLITNQISLLEQTFKQVSSLSDTQAIANDGTLTKCKNVSKEDSVYMKHALENVDTDLWAVYFQIQQFTKEGGSTDKLSQQYQQLNQRKDTLKQTNINFCPFVNPLELQDVTNQTNSFTDISTNAFISNLNSKRNWTYGKTSQQQFEINQFRFLLNNDVVQCPEDTPFASKGKCISCGKNQIFYLDTATCGTCSTGTDFNQVTHQCEPKTNTTCSGNQIYNANTKKCECPSGLPYFDGNNCLGCFIPQYWNSKTNKCESCQKGSYYSLVNGTCLTCPVQSNFISSLSGCHDECTLSKPYFDGSMCISCPQVFNPNTRQCEDCPDGLDFNAEKGVCLENIKPAYKKVKCDKGYVFNSQNGQCVKETECVCPSNYVYNINTSKCACPLNLPYDTGVNCINCQAPNSWDKDLKKCTEPEAIQPVPIAKVPVVQTVTIPTTTLNVTANVTANVTSNVTLVSNTSVSGPTTTPSLVIPTCGTGEVWNQVSKTCVCSSTTPYRTLTGMCIACNAPNKWSTSLYKCLSPQITCKSNFVYDAATQTCICPRDLPFSDGQKCQSCFLPMYWNNLDKLCKHCPQNQYFNPMSRKCEYCPQTRPLLVNHVCQACTQGTRYNPVALRCETINCVGGSVYKFEINDCACPDSKKPFYNGKECVSCLSPNRWDLTSRSCVYGSPSFSNATLVSK